MKPYSIKFTAPAPVTGLSGKHADVMTFQRLMRHSKECRQKINEMLQQEGIAGEARETEFHANERRIVMTCSDNAIAKIRALSFVEKIETVKPQSGPRRKKGPQP